ncbi:MAG: DciA family protein [Pseudomonadota bacterium]
MQKNRHISALGEVLSQGLPGSLACRLPDAGLIRAWRELVGVTVAAKAWPVCLEAGGLLVVAVAGSLWRQELSLRVPELLRGLTERGQVVAGLRLVPARTPPPPPREPPPPPPLGPEDEETIQVILREVSDPGLRQALASLMRAQLQAQKAAYWDGD